MKPVTTEATKVQLPQLIKNQDTFKLFVPKNVEEKIRYLIRKFPHTEWSGVLFYKHTGTFEDKNLEIHCEDIYPMDLGNSGFTNFRMSEEVVGYMADNIELFECCLGLIHSHHTMGAFFSGQDIDTLQAEGNDTNCFVSLIVDTMGTYKAAITRKIQNKIEITTTPLGISYEFFGDGTVEMGKDTREVEKRVVSKDTIEYFMLDVEREEVSNPLDYLDTRFEEIEKKKERSTFLTTTPDTKENKITYPKVYDWDDGSDIYSDTPFYEYLHQKEASKEPTLWDSDVMDDLVVDKSKLDIDADDIQRGVAIMFTGSIFVKMDEDSLRKWVSISMESQYKNNFSFDSDFIDYRDFIVEFVLNKLEDKYEISYKNDKYEEHHNALVVALKSEALKYQELCPFIKDFVTCLEREYI